MGNVPGACGTACSRSDPQERQCLSRFDRIVDFEDNLPFSKISVDEFERLALSAAKIKIGEDGLYYPPLNQSTVTLRQITNKFSTNQYFSQLKDPTSKLCQMLKSKLLSWHTYAPDDKLNTSQSPIEHNTPNTNSPDS